MEEQEQPSTPQVLETVDLPDDLFGPKKQGKARDTWVLPDGKIRIMVTTDRQSAYDKLVCLVLGKGRQLNMLSAFWFEKTQDIVQNHLLAVPHPNVMICQQVEAILLEMVVRGYITGESSTSLWRNYRDRTNVYRWLELPPGLRKNQKLPEIVSTPTTKAMAGSHDEPISPLEAARRFGEIYWEMEKASGELFRRASQIYAQAGLILVDTKFEFGIDSQGNLTLIDELFTPDSSRIWRAKTYEERISAGQEPEGYDKEFLRLWLKERGFSGDGPVPEVPTEITNRLAKLYTEPYKRLIGQDLSGVDSSPESIRKAILKYFGSGNEVF